MKRLLLLSIVLLYAMTAQAQSSSDFERSRLHFCVDWGYAQNFYRHHHYNILSEEGYRINEDIHSLNFCPNTFIHIGLDYMAGDKVSVGLFTGFVGGYEKYSVVPLLFNFSFYPHCYDNDGFFSYISGGVGFRAGDNILHNTASVLIELGESYRTILSRYCWIDFRLSLRGCFASPLIPSPDRSGFVTEDNIRANNAEFYALCFTIAIGI